ncbi:uncharacterized protein ACWYII_007580 isoform 1-T1 [Salvelinus alpinus]
MADKNTRMEANGTACKLPPSASVQSSPQTTCLEATPHTLWNTGSSICCIKMKQQGGREVKVGRGGKGDSRPLARGVLESEQIPTSCKSSHKSRPLHILIPATSTYSFLPPPLCQIVISAHYRSVSGSCLLFHISPPTTLLCISLTTITFDSPQDLFYSANSNLTPPSWFF